MIEKGYYIFVDAEYAYSSAAREGQVPNYKNLMALFEKHFSPSVKLFYHVGEEKKRHNICNFLSRLGADYNVVQNYTHASKTQLVGANMSIDVMNYLHDPKIVDPTIVILSGDDYVIPIVQELHQRKVRQIVMHYSNFMAIDLLNLLETNKIEIHSLNKKYFTWPKV